jgi:hypothetical protein
MAFNKHISESQHNFYQSVESAENRDGDAVIKSSGLKLDQLTLPNVNLYCNVHAILEHSWELINKQDTKYLNNFKRFWLATSGKVTSKSKKRVLGMIQYYAQKEQNYKLREKRLTRNNKSV